MLTLVLGGAASGKSGYAESLVLKTALPRYYIATMQVWDAECAARVEKHRRMRAAKQFETVECPLHLENIRLPARGTALLEDLGNLTANELYDPAGAGENAVFASHCSTEPAARLVLEALGKVPLLTAGLHLGEGTGAVASIPLWDMALAVYRDCYSFTEGGITPYTPQC